MTTVYLTELTKPYFFVDFNPIPYLYVVVPFLVSFFGFTLYSLFSPDFVTTSIVVLFFGLARVKYKDTSSRVDILWLLIVKILSPFLSPVSYAG